MRNYLEMKNKQSGFTLIEIAIVMVIIGLLIGGVLKGQALIDNAKVKSVINDMNGVQAAYYGYYDRKHVYPAKDADYKATSSGGFWGSTRTEGLLTGDPASTVPGLNAMGGYLGVVTSPFTGLSGDAVCTSVLAKYAQGIDAGLDDGFSSKGTVMGGASVLSGGALNEGLATAAPGYTTTTPGTPLAAGYGTDGYVVICKQL
jgi:prepilin-type N-terminal cleavage/methylation domain-containing protein